MQLPAQMLECCVDRMKAACLANVLIERTCLVLGFLSRQVYLMEHLQGKPQLQAGSLDTFGTTPQCQRQAD